MQVRNRFLALSAIALLLTACSKESVDPPPPPVVTSPPAGVGMAPQGASQGSDPSVPSATSALSGEAPASTAAATTIRPGATLTDAQEKSAMPMAGQGDSHSAPKATDKGASAP